MDRDRELIQIVDAATLDAARRSGAWLVCHPGCTQCCLGPFPITQLDVIRLRRGLAEIEPEKARRVRERARASVGHQADDAPCPALDLDSGLCDVYEWRPITCRTFGPPVRIGESEFAVCELCYQGASEEEVAACEAMIDPENLEGALLDELDRAGQTGETTVAAALAAE